MVFQPVKRLLGKLQLYHLLFPLYAGLLGLRHLLCYYSGAVLLHSEELARNFQQIDRGTYWVPGPELGTVGLSLGGPLYTWLSCPARLMENPATGTIVWYFLLELLAIGLWILWGQKTRMGRDLVWGAALLLVLFPEQKMEYAENHTLMAYLALPVFAAFVRGLEARHWRAMLLPGVLVGMFIHMHQIALCVGPALVLIVILERRLWLRRSLAVGAGMLLVTLCSLKGIVTVPDGPDGNVKAFVSLGNYFHHLGFLLRDPLPVVGLLLALLMWVRHRRGSSDDGHGESGWGPGQKLGQKLAVLWFVLGGLLLAFVLLFFAVSDESRVAIRFALLQPARAVLSVLALLWFAWALRRLVRRLGGRGPEFSHLLLATAVVMMGALGYQVHRQQRIIEEERRSRGDLPCSIPNPTDNRAVKLLPFGESVLARWRPPPGELQFHGIDGLTFFLRALHLWNRHPPPSDSKTQRHVMITPRFARVEPSRISGAQAVRSLLLVSGSRLVEIPTDGTTARHTLDGGHLNPGETMVLWTTGYRLPEKVWLEADGAPIRPRDACRSGGQGWYLFRFSRPVKAGRLHLLVRYGENTAPKRKEMTGEAYRTLLLHHHPPQRADE